MSNIDKIRQEIERLVKMNKTKNGFPASFLCAVRIESYVKLLSFIDSLPDEPVSNDLEEAAETFCDTLEGKEAWSYGPDHYDWGDVNNAFIAGAEWQYQKDRGEFAKIKAKTWCEGFDAHKEQMLKDAVEAEVLYIGETQDVSRTIKIPQMQEWLKPFKDGDKVRIVILKQNEE